MNLELNTPYTATYIGTAPLTSREPQTIQIKKNSVYGVKVVAEHTEIPYASLHSVASNWDIQH